MRNKSRVAILLIAVVAASFATKFYLDDKNVAVLNPRGWVAMEQKSLLITTLLLMMIVVIPVFIMTFLFAWKYRESNKKAKYTPDWDNNRILEMIWWTIPCAIILTLAIITWSTTHKLDPAQPLHASNKTMKIQVVALEWKWLFIYPEQGIATVNYVQFPEDTPVDFEITGDAPMNSFWIPQLGGQIYAMNGMTTHLNLIANEKGLFDGVSANLSGYGFSGMKFKASATSQLEFNNWTQEVKNNTSTLDILTYQKLAEPSENNPISYYGTVQGGLYNEIIMKYTAPGRYNDPIIYHKHEGLKEESNHD